MCDEVEFPEEYPGAEEADGFTSATPEDELDDWKEQLREKFETWLEDVEEIPEAEELVETPDLLSLYAELVALRNENRKGNRKSAEVFSQFGESLGQFDSEMKRLREQWARIETSTESKAEIPRSQCLALVEILDRMNRLRAALARQPQRSGFAFFKPDGAWKDAWENLGKGFSIVTMHLETLLEQAGVRAMTTRGAAFDPVTMVVVDVVPTRESPPNIVVEELSAGYRWRDEVLRPAEVKISKRIE